MQRNVYRIGRNSLLVLSVVVAAFVTTDADAAQETVPEARENVESGIPGGMGRGVPAPTEFVLSNGSATSVMPIVVPPGRLGMSPKIALVYNSNRTNGIVGVGWDVDLGSIQRSTKQGVCYTCNDYTIGGEELVARDDWGDSSFYARKRETQFTRYEHLESSSGWIATARDGKRYYYGPSSASQQSNGSDVFKWCLDTIVDANGNFIKLYYSHSYGQIYPDRIEYTGNENTGLAPAYEIKFLFYEGRPDKPWIYTTGYAVKTALRLDGIKIYRTYVSGEPDLVGEYVLDYGNPTQGLSTGRSLLESVTRYGSNGESLPPTEYLYNTASVGFGTATPWGAGRSNDNPENHTRFQGFADFNADGRQDLWIAYPDSDGRIMVGLSNGSTFSMPSEWGQKSGEIGFADFDGDGKQDLWVAQTDPSDRILVGLSNGTSSFGSIEPWADNIDWDLDSRRPWEGGGIWWKGFADLNGDGKQDFWFVKPGTTTLTVRLSEGSAGFALEADWEGSNNWASTRWMGFADFNGDGKQDLWFVEPPDNYPGPDEVYSRLMVRISTGSGLEDEQEWAVKVDWAEFTYNYWRSQGLQAVWDGQGWDDFNYWVLRNEWADSGRKGFHDFNGDGKQDLWFLKGYFDQYGGTSPEVFVRLSDGSGFELEQRWASDHDWDGRDRGIADLNGDGKGDFWYIAWYDGGGTPKIKVRLSDGSEFKTEVEWPEDNLWAIDDWRGFADVSGDGKQDLWYVKRGSSSVMVATLDVATPDTERPDPADLLWKTLHSTGGHTEIQYKPSSAYSNTSLPFVLQTASETIRDDGLGNTITTEYDYGLGDYLSDIKEFMGFGQRSETIVSPDPSKSLTEKTLYHQSEYLKGRPYRTDLFNPPDTMLIQTMQSWEEEPLGESNSRFLKLNSKVTTTYENGSLAYTTTEAYTYYTAHGSIDTTTTSSDSGDDVVVTDTDYGYFSLVGTSYPLRVTSEVLKDGSGTVVRDTAYGYELGTGNMLYKDSWNDEKGLYQRVVDMTDTDCYDDYGNATKVKDGKGYSHWTEYDLQTHTFPVKTINAKLQEVEFPEADYDYAIGKPKTKVDTNENRTYYDYDGFGRTIQVDYPDGGQTKTIYCDDEFPRKVKTEIKENAQGETIDSWVYLDGLGRTIQTVSFGENGDAIVTKLYYDNFGRNYRTEGPFFVAEADFVPPAYDFSGPDPDHYPRIVTTYDRRGRPVDVISPIAPSTIDTGALEVVTHYDYDGLSTTITDPDGIQKTEEKDYLGRIVKVKDHADPRQLRMRTYYTYNQ